MMDSETLDQLRWPSSIDGTLVTSQEGSAVLQVHLTALNTFRLAHLLSFVPSITLGRIGVSIEVAAFLALQDFNARSGAVLPWLPERIKDCDLYFTMDLLDSENSPTASVRKLLEKMPPLAGLAEPSPFAILGAGYSLPSQSLAIIGGIQGIPQCSMAATSQELDKKSEYPLFTRTMATNKGEAIAAAAYFHSLGAYQTAVLYEGVIYAKDFAKHYADAVADLGDRRPLLFEFIPWQGEDTTQIRRALQMLQDSQIRYTYAIVSRDDTPIVADLASQMGLMGGGQQADHMWLWAQGTNYFTVHDGPTELPARVVQAFHGVGGISLHVTNPEYVQQLQAFQENQAMQRYYVSKQENQSQTFFHEFDFSSLIPLHWSITNYDAFMAVAIAACEVEKDFPTGQELYEQMIQTTFEGASGYVAFDPKTGTRSGRGLTYLVKNVLATHDGNGTAHITAVPSAIVDPGNSENTVQTLTPFVYNDNTNNPPMYLPPLEQNLNLIEKGVLITGLTLAGLAMAMTIGWIVWVARHRKKRKVASAQPFFLYMICIGNFLLASSIIPTSFQEPMSQSTLNLGCELAPWLLCLGFVTTFSALFTKNGRINAIYKNAQKFRRVVIEPKDVLKPFLFLLVLNVALLITDTVVNPSEWVREEGDGQDIFGRPTDSYGMCKREGPVSTFCTIGLVTVNFIPLVLSNYQSYKTRNLPSEFNESRFIAYSMASMLEAMLIGAPIVIVAYLAGEPTIYFLLRAILIVLVCTIVCCFILVPKCVDFDLHQSKKRLNLRKSTKNLNLRKSKIRRVTAGTAPVLSKSLTGALGSQADVPSDCEDPANLPTDGSAGVTGGAIAEQEYSNEDTSFRKSNLEDRMHKSMQKSDIAAGATGGAIAEQGLSFGNEDTSFRKSNLEDRMYRSMRKSISMKGSSKISSLTRRLRIGTSAQDARPAHIRFQEEKTEES